MEDPNILEGNTAVQEFSELLNQMNRLPQGSSRALLLQQLTEHEALPLIAEKAGIEALLERLISDQK